MRVALPCLIVGAVFGFVLGWARLTNPDTIYDMLRLRELYVFLIMGSAIATATIGTRLLKAGRARTLMGGEIVTWIKYPASRDHVIGSALFGLGWSVANSCPGPIAAMIGRGQWSGLFIAAGLFAGIALRDAHQNRLHRPGARTAAGSAVAQPEGAGL
jgi:uncharacterized membrane protein YedE/YeeE